jgi:hypothetical protein
MIQFRCGEGAHRSGGPRLAGRVVGYSCEACPISAKGKCERCARCLMSMPRRFGAGWCPAVLAGRLRGFAGGASPCAEPQRWARSQIANRSLRRLRRRYPDRCRMCRGGRDEWDQPERIRTSASVRQSGEGRGCHTIKDATCPAVHAELQAAQKGVPFVPMRDIVSGPCCGSIACDRRRGL